MSTELLELRAERLRLARRLGVTPGELDFLDRLPAQALRTYRHALEDLLFDENGERFAKVMQAAGLLPKPVAARIAVRAIPPTMTAMMSGLLSPQDAAEFASHMPTSYMADLAAAADPRRVGHLVPHLGRSVVIDGAAELVARKDFVTAGLLVGCLNRAYLADVLTAISDPADLFEVALLIDDKSVLDDIMDHLSDADIEVLSERAVELDMVPLWESLADHCRVDNADRARRILQDVQSRS
ncbi:MAG: hypothetical protein KDB86_13985 [Actinobacteria bacterium]|nr:hypothetical protein [Actinomycetota bacterium]MCB9388323.1 hypothetical protein [Acidimicrobiia bacterium]